MKVILTGSTGFIGKAILTEALAHLSITSIVVLSRRALDESLTQNPKIKVVIMDDFLKYTPEVLSQLEGAKACIWAIGKPALKSAPGENCREVEIDFTRAAAEAFSSSLAPAVKGKPFRFVLCSGAYAERDTSKKLWFMQETRINKGEMESILLDYAKKVGSNLEVSIARPGGVLAKNTAVPGVVSGLLDFIRVDELAATMVDEAISGVNGNRTFECTELRNRGRVLLQRASS